MKRRLRQLDRCRVADRAALAGNLTGLGECFTFSLPASYVDGVHMAQDAADLVFRSISEGVVVSHAGGCAPGAI